MLHRPKKFFLKLVTKISNWLRKLSKSFVQEAIPFHKRFNSR